MKFQFTNRASTTLAAPLAVDGTYITVAPGTGERFPATTPAAPAQISIVSVTGASEITRCTSRAGDVMTIERGQEGTSVSAFAEGSLVELRVTAEVLNSFLTSDGGTLHGDLNIQGHNLIASSIVGAPYVDYVKTNVVFPPDAVFSSSIEFLNGGIVPRINGNSILTTIMLHSAVFLWWGNAAQLPPWLKICDGTLGTPDMRDRFPLGANNDGNLGWVGGDWSRLTYSSGGHNHSGATQNQNLGSFNLPGLTAPSLNVTRLELLDQALGAAQPNSPARNFVQNVSMAGGGTYSGSAQHAHGISFEGDHQHLIDTAPPYFRLHFVMFRSMQIN